MTTRFIRTRYFNRQWRKTKATESDYASVKEEILRLGENADKLTARISEVRVAIKGSGKSGGARVFYFAQIKGFVFLLTCYDRRKKTGLSEAELKEIDDLAKAIIQKYK